MSTTPTLGGVNPILVVRDLEASIAYYTQKLGFHLNWQHQDFFADVFRGKTSIFLSVADQGQPGAWVWIGTDNVTALHAEYVASGALIRQPPTNFQWALEMQVADPDGNVLRIGSDPLPDQPFGPWLDMRGQLWQSNAAGGWTRIDPVISASGTATAS
jgi:catechol 2,3-dioxygenase-like lactoylglutathione lyase family enzyme